MTKVNIVGRYNTVTKTWEYGYYQGTRFYVVN